MPILYGKGYASAFFRLQVLIYEATGDNSLFAWKYPDDMYMIPHGSECVWRAC